jgi:hypothetical protein
LAQNKNGLYDSSNDMYYAYFDIKNDLDHFNGQLDVEVHVADVNAEVKDKWTVGTINVWFIQGLEEGDNLGIKAEYNPEKIIEHIFSSEEPEKSIVVIYLCYFIFLSL